MTGFTEKQLSLSRSIKLQQTNYTVMTGDIQECRHGYSSPVKSYRIGFTQDSRNTPISTAPGALDH
jgi:hypothetical protein